MKKTKPESQNSKILNYMREHDSITPLEAYNNFGCMRLGARIADLERKGHTILHTPTKVANRYGQNVRVTAYALLEEAKA